MLLQHFIEHVSTVFTCFLKMTTKTHFDIKFDKKIQTHMIDMFD